MPSRHVKWRIQKKDYKGWNIHILSNSQAAIQALDIFGGNETADNLARQGSSYPLI